MDGENIILIGLHSTKEIRNISLYQTLRLYRIICLYNRSKLWNLCPIKLFIIWLNERILIFCIEYVVDPYTEHSFQRFLFCVTVYCFCFLKLDDKGKSHLHLHEITQNKIHNIIYICHIQWRHEKKKPKQIPKIWSVTQLDYPSYSHDVISAERSDMTPHCLAGSAARQSAISDLYVLITSKRRWWLFILCYCLYHLDTTMHKQTQIT
jgi:hypothetical protein